MTLAWRIWWWLKSRHIRWLHPWQKNHLSDRLRTRMACLGGAAHVLHMRLTSDDHSGVCEACDLVGAEVRRLEAMMREMGL